MSLLDNASLLLTPNAYKEGKLYSVIPSNGNGDFTTTRATTATRVNADGLVDLVPYNLVQYSEQFDNAAWTKSNAGTGVLPLVVANQGTAPDGTLTADRIQLNRGSGGTVSDSSVVRQQITVANNATTTISIYLKSFDGNNYQIVFSNSGVVVSQKITVTNQWQRFLLTGVSAGVVANIEIQLREGVFAITGQSVTADLLVWGAQVVEGTSARDYLRTETRLNIPRVDYSLGGCPNILLEPQRTNLALQSSSFDSATWTKSSTSVTANSTISPSGIVDADTITTSSTFNNIFQGVSVLASTAYTFSFWVLRGTMTDLKYSIYNVSGTSNIIAPTSYYSQTNSSTWTRIVVTFTTPVGCTLINIYPIRDTGVIGTCFLWGAQLEAGAYATSFIPTTTASVTRNADSITRNNIFTNGLITASGGTWFVELRNNVARVRDAGSTAFGIGNNAALTDNSLLFISPSSGRITFRKTIGGTATSLFSTTTDVVKLAVKWNGSTADVFVNGVKQVSATAFAITNMEFINCQSANVPYFINEMALFPTPLTDAQCIALTQ